MVCNLEHGCPETFWRNSVKQNPLNKLRRPVKSVVTVLPFGVSHEEE